MEPGPFGQAYAALDRALTKQIRALIARLQALGLVRHRRDSARRTGLQQHEHDVH
ncbi:MULTISPECIES: hypothetical protein [unclassified Mesorhizobium]|uniref:hypothetical protein n=1 Tax=unclassified Mesorhizobium TaxID=325217 RepID=UPI0003CF4CE3|nr:hypothetical protein [Mesorhizobium sp. LNHC252B00]ESY72779.1 hypothetical protein X743_14480 [Mesorhizobium sp. LNHC252B00]